jgi:hypothetical protein
MLRQCYGMRTAAATDTLSMAISCSRTLTPPCGNIYLSCKPALIINASTKSRCCDFTSPSVCRTELSKVCNSGRPTFVMAKGRSARRTGKGHENRGRLWFATDCRPQSARTPRTVTKFDGFSSASSIELLLRSHERMHVFDLHDFGVLRRRGPSDGNERLSGRVRPTHLLTPGAGPGTPTRDPRAGTISPARTKSGRVSSCDQFAACLQLSHSHEKMELKERLAKTIILAWLSRPQSMCGLRYGGGD